MPPAARIPSPCRSPTRSPRLRAQFGDLEAGAETGVTAAVAGRVVFSRNTGKLCFATLQAGDGSRIQAMVSLAGVGEESLQRWKELVDLGDHVFVRGEVISSRRGELSIMVADWQVAAKAILPLPNMYGELSEESRVRSRYLDLIVRDQARETVRARAKVNASLRQTFADRGYIEVETPMLQVQHGGASARPFTTHSNAFDTELYLRIAPELFLKRAVVGGLDRVFEINRNFRNEGADSTHSPEFAMLESYEAYSDYNGIADLTQDLVQNAARSRSPAPRPSRGPTAPSTISAASGIASRCTTRCPRHPASRSPPRHRSPTSARSPRAKAWRSRRCPPTASSSRSCGSTSSSPD